VERPFVSVFSLWTIVWKLTPKWSVLIWLLCAPACPCMAPKLKKQSFYKHMEGKANAVAWSNLASCIDFSAPEEHSAHEVSTCSTGEHSLPVEPTATRFELSSYGDVILSLTIHATTVMQCVLVVSQQWDSPVNVKQLDQKTWIAELVDHGLPTIFSS